MMKRFMKIYLFWFYAVFLFCVGYGITGGAL